MSNTDPAPEAVALRAGVVHAVDVLEARKAAIGDGTEVRRLLPQRTLRTIGAWCFLDHYGPDDTSAGPGMQVPPHPHIGLQTASWLFDGLVLHRDSLGSEQLIRPGELNLMTSGRGIAHSEESPGSPARPALLHGVQLWIALPASHQFTEPGFAHHADLPVLRSGDARITVVVGEHAGERSPATVFSPLVGLEVTLPAGGSVTLPAADGFEYGVIAADGPAGVGCPALAGDAARVEPGMLAHLPGRGAVHRAVRGRSLPVPRGRRGPAGRAAAHVVEFRRQDGAGDHGRADAWIAGEFGEVRGYAGDPLAAPPLPPGGLKAR